MIASAPIARAGRTRLRRAASHRPTPRRVPSRTVVVLLAAVAASLLAAPVLAVRPLGAQDQPVPPWERRSTPSLSLGGAVLYSSARSGGARVDDGVGFDVHAAVAVSALSLGVGFQRVAHAAPNAGVDATYQGVYVEPRIAVAPYGNFTPYLAGRVGFLRQQLPATTQLRSTDRDVVLLGAGAGALVSVARAVQLDLGAMWTDYRGRGGVEDTEFPGPFRGGTGGGVQLRAGVVLGFDRWGR